MMAVGTQVVAVLRENGGVARRNVMFFLCLSCSSQTAVQRDPDSNVPSAPSGWAEETLLFLVQKGEVVPSATWWVTQVSRCFAARTRDKHISPAASTPCQDLCRKNRAPFIITPHTEICWTTAQRYYNNFQNRTKLYCQIWFYTYMELVLVMLAHDKSFSEFFH